MATAAHLICIGAGAGASLTTLHLARLVARDPAARMRVTLIDPDRPVTGAAFGTTDPLHLLNVPASGMSVSNEERFDFVEWCQQTGLLATDAAPYWFAPRMEWARYARARLAEAVAATNGRLVLTHLPATAVDVAIAPTGKAGPAVRIETTAGVVTGDHLLLATGLPSVGREWEPHDLDDIPGYVPDPWRPGALDQLASTPGDVVVVGSGLTMVDVALTAWSQDPTRRVVAISRGGNLPTAHAERYLGEVVPRIEHWGDTLAEIRAATYAHIDAVAQLQGDWRPAIDGIRYQVAALWQRLDIADRLAFVRDLSGHWGIHRHRMPPSSVETLTRATADDAFAVHSDKITGVRGVGIGSAGVEVETASGRQLRCSHLVNCTGPRADIRTQPNPLLRALLDAETVVTDPTHLGLRTVEGQCVDSTCRPQPIHTLGGLRRGELWESTAIPEIREQAAEIARRLL